QAALTLQKHTYPHIDRQKENKLDGHSGESVGVAVVFDIPARGNGLIVGGKWNAYAGLGPAAARLKTAEQFLADGLHDCAGDDSLNHSAFRRMRGIIKHVEVGFRSTTEKRAAGILAKIF